MAVESLCVEVSDSNIVWLCGDVCCLFAGGRLDWGVWKYNSSGFESADPFSAAANSFLRPLYSTAASAMKRRKGNKKKGRQAADASVDPIRDASADSPSSAAAASSLGDSQQDHRILAVASCPLKPNAEGGDCYLIALCDSRGVVQLQRVDMSVWASDSEARRRCGGGDDLGEEEGGGRGVSEVEVLTASEHPILCCSLVPVSSLNEGGDVYLAVVGDTTGRIGVWLIGSGMSTWKSRSVYKSSQVAA
jgi:hypothetical protein